MAGSIGDGPSGGMYGYRMSKAALNVATANLAHELRPRGIHVVALHPGFVRTEMTGGNGNVEPADAAAGLIARLDELDAAGSGSFVHADGRELPWPRRRRYRHHPWVSPPSDPPPKRLAKQG